MSTMRDVAAMAGVSAKTVSRVLNDEPYVRAEIRERVLAAVAALRYTPNLVAKSFRSGRDTAVGVVVPSFTDAFFGAVVQAVVDTLRANGFAALVSTAGEPDQERRTVEALVQRQVAGLLIASVSAHQRWLRPIAAAVPVVLVDRPAAGVKVDVVTEDDAGGAALAAEHLIGLGHRRIALVGDDPAIATIARRLDGVRRVFATARIPERSALQLFSSEPDTDVTGFLDAALDGRHPVTAVLALNSGSALPVVAHLRERHRDDVAVVSFGDFPMASLLQPSVTVIDQNPADLGATAARRLIDRIADPTLGVGRPVVLPVSLVIRGSSRPAPGRR